ncbi:MAG: acyl carrier protein [Deltaproteobacteria bacterium]|nr:acyl carrier protein [Deltaproteobacteria bacterium]
MPEMTPETENEIREMVIGFFADECDMEPDEITPDTNIIEDLEGDSLMFMALLEKIRRKYGIGIELKTLARHLMKKPANTIAQVVDLSVAMVRHGDDIINVDL